MQKAVLVVEDEALIRFVAVDVLEDDGYVVHEAGSVLEAAGKRRDIQVACPNTLRTGSRGDRLVDVQLSNRRPLPVHTARLR